MFRDSNKQRTQKEEIRLDGSEDAALEAMWPILSEGFITLGTIVEDNTLGDIVPMIANGPKYMNTTLYELAKKNGGVGIGYLGPWWLNSPKVVVVSGTKNARRIVDYGENPEDSHARDAIAKRIGPLFGTHTVITKHGTEAQEERTHFKKFVTEKNGIEAVRHLCRTVFDEWINEWDDNDSYQNNIAYFTADVISRHLAGVEHFSRKFVPLLRRYDRIISTGIEGAEFDEVTQEMLAMNAELMTPENVHVSQNDHIAYYLSTNFEQLTYEEKKEALKETLLGAGALAETNLSFLIVGLLALIYENNDILEKLRDEIANCEDWETSYNDPEKMPFLHCCYLEALRYLTPTSMVIRTNSKPFVLVTEDENGNEVITNIPANSYLCAPLRRINNECENARTYDPSRHEKEENKKFTSKISGDNFIPFSDGRRPCPAGAAFVPEVAKFIVAKIVSGYNLKLNDKFPDIPLEETYIRLPKEYYATLEKHTPEAKSSCRI